MRGVLATLVVLSALVAADAFAPTFNGAALMQKQSNHLHISSMKHMSAASGIRMETKAITPDYRLALSAILLGTVVNQDLHLGWVGWPLVFIGSFLCFQTTQVRFKFTDSDIEVVRVSGLQDDGMKAGVESSGENVLQGGGANKWSFKSVTNWEFWWPGFPILVYFKESQTKADGQIHFFPIIMDGKELYEQMFKKMGPSVNEKIKPEDWKQEMPLSPPGFAKLVKKVEDALGFENV